MTNEEMRAENILLKQQLEELMSLTPNSETDWKSLLGTFNESANGMINSARMKNHISKSRRHETNPEPGTEWTKVDEIVYKAYETVIANQLKIHAIYECRERKRNAQLGIAPTLAELVSMIRDEPNQTNLDANSLNHTQQNQRDKVPQR